MSNISVVPRFQKPWALTSSVDSAGTSTCHGCLSNLTAPFDVFLFPPWASPTVPMPPSAAPPSCCALAPVLSPCTFLLFILGLYVISLGKRDWDQRAPHSFSVSSYCAGTRPSFGHDRACSIKKFLPQPSQVAGMSCSISPYLRRRLSRNSS